MGRDAERMGQKNAGSSIRASAVRRVFGAAGTLEIPKLDALSSFGALEQPRRAEALAGPGGPLEDKLAVGA